MHASLLHFSLDEAQWQDDWASLVSLASQQGKLKFIVFIDISGAFAKVDYRIELLLYLLVTSVLKILFMKLL